MHDTREKVINCMNCAKQIHHKDVRVCSKCKFSACKHCVTTTTCPQCKHPAGMQNPKEMHKN